MESVKKSNNEFIRHEMDAINIQLNSVSKHVNQMWQEVVQLQESSVLSVPNIDSVLSTPPEFA